MQERVSQAPGKLKERAEISTFHSLCVRVLRRHAVLARGGVDAGGIDRRRVFTEGVEEGSRGERVDQTRNAAAQRMNLDHRFAAEWIARSAGNANAMFDVIERLLLRQRAERVTQSDALA